MIRRVALAVLAGMGAGAVLVGCGDEGGVRRGIEYHDGLELDLYVPDESGTRPAVVLVHGGGFVAGDREQLVPYAEALAGLGYVVAAIDYRLSDGSWFPTDRLDDPGLRQAAARAREDATAAVTWLRAAADRYEVDRGRIAVLGYSAGGITAVEVASHGAPVQAGVAIAGAGIELDALKAGDGPLLLFHGDADVVVPVDLADDTCDAAGAGGVACRVRRFPGEGHGIAGSQLATIVAETDAYLRGLPAVSG